ncbi:MAG TPA: TonB-dependent receptor [Woeseiaceae bacterium]|nr:TonB-dependent receptor [Woeseiaceae bacterium]
MARQYTRLRTAFLFVLGSAAVAGPALSQDRQVIEEVVVTAQKTEQSAQDIGIAINALSGQELEARRIETPLDIQAVAPNINVKEISPGLFPVFTIRGVGLNDFSANNNPTVGVYLDEIFLTSTTQLTFQLYDIERVEVLKGPQGTLYGRNTTGGAISFITAKPAMENDWSVDLGAGDYELAEGGFMLNRALSDTLAVRFAGRAVNQGEGFYESRTLGGEDIGAREEYAGRFQVAWLPTDAIDVNLKIEASSADSEAGQFEHFGTLQPGVFPPAPCQPALQGRVDPVNCVDALGYSDPDGDPFTGDWNNDARYTNDSFGTTLTVDAAIGAGTFTSVTGWLSFEREAYSDTDAGPFVQAEFDVQDEIDQITQELRYAWSATDNLDLIVGGFFSRDEVDIRVPGDLSDLLLTRVLIQSEQTTTSAAAFVHWDWFLTEVWSLTGGLRITTEEKEYTGGMADQNPFGTSCLLSPVCNPGFVGPFQLAFNDDEIDDTEPSWRLGLNYHASDDVLAYASVARGFKSGGFFGGGFVTSDAALEPFDSETLTAWEVGFKSQMLGDTLRLNGAAFYYDYEDVQTFTQVPAGGLTVLKLSNVDEAEILGAEFDLLWRPIDGLDLQLAAGWLDTELGSFAAPGGGQLPAGNELPNAPELSVNAFARYEWPIGDLGFLSVQADYSYTDETFKEAVNRPLLAADDFSVWGARIALRDVDDRWEVAFWGKNLGDKEYLLHAFDNGIGNGGRTYGAPRTWGVTFNLRALR